MDFFNKTDIIPIWTNRSVLNVKKQVRTIVWKLLQNAENKMGNYLTDFMRLVMTVTLKTENHKKINFQVNHTYKHKSKSSKWMVRKPILSWVYYKNYITAKDWSQDCKSSAILENLSKQFTKITNWIREIFY